MSAEQRIVDLSNRLKEEPGYYAPRLEPEQLEARFRERRVVTRTENGAYEAFAALWPTLDSRLLELGTVWVGQGLRGNGMRDQIMAEAVRLAPQGTSLFLITSAPSIVETAKSLGFHIVLFASSDELYCWGRTIGFPEDRKPPEGAVLSNVADAIRTGRPTLLRTLLVRSVRS